jgi:hypothetical protein
MRSSTLPRLTCAETSSRSPGSSARRSSGRRSARSRKRPFTERNSTVTPALGAAPLRAGGASLPSFVAAASKAPAEALA